MQVYIRLTRWQFVYEIAGAIDELMPKGIFGIEGYDEFHRLYFAKIDAIGVRFLARLSNVNIKNGERVAWHC